MSRRAVIMASLSLFGLTISSQAAAQEQENPSTPGQIPDPSTYQGSTVLQQQSDQQDQSFRQQQQQQSQGYQQQSSGNYGGQSGGSAPAEQAGIRCIRMLDRLPALAPLRGLVELGLNNRDPRYFTIPRRPTAAEKPVLLRWASARRQCPLITFQTATLTRANMTVTGITIRLIGQLAQGLMTYGEFNYKRALNTESFIRFRDSQ
jgi:hypothetical protein